MASVSFPVSQGGLHSHCVQHCIVQAGCNQADESCISKNALRGCFFFFSLLPPCWEKCCEIPVQMQRKKKHPKTKPQPFFLFVLFFRKSTRAFIRIRLERWFTQVPPPPQHHFFPTRSRWCSLFLAFAICGSINSPPSPRNQKSKRPLPLTVRTLPRRLFYLFNYPITRVAGVLISGL